MRLFGGENIKGLMSRMGMKKGEPIVHPWLNRSIERAQKKVEERNFEVRKHLLEYDDVLNEQRKFIYARRDEIISDPHLKDRVIATGDELFDEIFERFRASGDNPADPRGHAPGRGEGEPLPRSAADPRGARHPARRRSEDGAPGRAAGQHQREVRGDRRGGPQPLHPVRVPAGTSIRGGRITWRTSNRSARRSTCAPTARRTRSSSTSWKGSRSSTTCSTRSRRTSPGRSSASASSSAPDAAAGRGPSGRGRPGIAQRHGPVRRGRRLRDHGGQRPRSFPSSAGGNGGGSQPQQVQVKRTVPKVGRNDLCPCGSGKKYKYCHGQ